ncbi:MAG TPA: dienelactone hydrolase family protein [Candidatus Baltobacteraceae bacterium]|jgi:carboxymethylenebutenolidase|nr:dienelactone hydrolase family protein [Candidatus Baltobacteraceae bacterium]
MGKMIEFTRPDGAKAPGYLAESQNAGGAPGVVLFQEWWGLDDHIKETADRLASDGFRVLVPDLYRGRVATDREEAGHLMEGLNFADAATQDARGAARYLREHGAKRVGVTGFCVGGALAMLASMNDPEFDALVVWYGYPPAEAGDTSTIGIPFQGHWAKHDEFFKIEGVDELERKLQAKNAPYEFHRYDAKHAFYNPGGIGNHDPKHAETAWRRSVAFLEKNLS